MCTVPLQQCPMCRTGVHTVICVLCHVCRMCTASRMCSATRAECHVCTGTCAQPHTSTRLRVPTVASSHTHTPNSHVHPLSHVHHQRCTNHRTSARAMRTHGHTCTCHLGTSLLCTCSISPSLPCTRAVSLGDHRGTAPCWAVVMGWMRPAGGRGGAGPPCGFHQAETGPNSSHVGVSQA